MKVLIKWSNLLYLIMGLMLFSCASKEASSSAFVKKRRYNSGWHTNFHRNHPKRISSSKGFFSDSAVVKKSEVKKIKKDSLADQGQKPEIEASIVRTGSDSLSVDSVQTVETEKELLCDTLVFEDGKQIEAKVVSIDEERVKYKLCNNVDGPTFSHETRLIKEVKNGNGTLVKISDYYQFDEVADEAKGDKEVEEDDKVVEAWSFAGSLLAVVTSVLWPIAIVTVPILLTLGIVGFVRIRNNKSKFKYKWISIATIVYGAVVGALMLGLFLLLSLGV